MSIDKQLPVLGAALNVNSLFDYRSWIMEYHRDLELQDFVGHAVLDSDWTDLAGAIRKRLDGYEGRLGIHGPFFDLSISCQDPLVRDVVLKRLMQGLDAAEAVGASHMVIHSPFTHWDHNNFGGFVGSRERKFEWTHQTLMPVVKRAEDMGLMLVIENCDDKDADIRVQLARSFESEAVRVSIDTGHAHYAHVTNDAPPVDHFIGKAGAMLGHIHLQDADGYGDRHWPPGKGNVNWYSVFSTLAVIDAAPRLIIELRNHAEVRHGAEYLVALGLAR